jgi:hypothetical protein
VVTPALAEVIALGPTGPGKCHDLDGFILCSVKTDLGLSARLKTTSERLHDSLVDPGFEDSNLDDWPSFLAVRVAVATDRARTGLHSLAQTDGDGSVYQDIKGLEPGKSYLVSAWVSASPGATSTAQIALWDPGTNVLTESPPFHPGTEWQLLTHSMAASSSGTLRLHLFRRGGTGSIYWDDVSVSVLR